MESFRCEPCKMTWPRGLLSPSHHYLPALPNRNTKAIIENFMMVGVVSKSNQQQKEQESFSTIPALVRLQTSVFSNCVWFGLKHKNSATFILTSSRNLRSFATTRLAWFLPLDTVGRPGFSLGTSFTGAPGAMVKIICKNGKIILLSNWNAYQHCVATISYEN